MKITRDEPLTIGVALTVPEPWGIMIQERRAEYGDHLAWTIPTHITLLPPTQVPLDKARLVDEHLRDVASGQSTFRVRLSGTDTFRPVSQTSYLVVDEGAGECEALELAVRSGPLQRGLPFPYHPHVTLAVELADEIHDRAESDFSDFNCTFDVERIERYEVADHGVWEPIATFPLWGSAGGSV
ncbi:MAG: 2'-5' RNA ligase family protein [Actinomycetes bacterium]